MPVGEKVFLCAERPKTTDAGTGTPVPVVLAVIKQKVRLGLLFLLYLAEIHSILIVISFRNFPVCLYSFMVFGRWTLIWATWN